MYLSDGAGDEVDLNSAQTTGARCAAIEERIGGARCRYPALLPCPIERMRRIDRQAVVANGQAVAALIDGPYALVAIPAERAQRPETELVVIAAVPWMMVRDGGRRDAALFLAQGAQRLDLQLMLGPSSPGLQVIPRTPVERLRRCEIARVHSGEISTLVKAKTTGKTPPPPCQAWPSVFDRSGSAPGSA
jgi:hypothetical protein